MCRKTIIFGFYTLKLDLLDLLCSEMSFLLAGQYI